MISEGLSTRYLYNQYLLSFLIFIVPVDIALSLILDLYAIGNIYYTLPLIAIPVGTSSIVYVITTYFTQLQRTTGTSRLPLGSNIGVGVLFLVLFLNNIAGLNAVNEALLFLGISLILAGLIMVIIAERVIDGRKLIA